MQENTAAKYTIILFYKYEEVQNPEGFREWNKQICEELGLKGRIIVAREGINATVEGKTEDIEKYLTSIKEIGQEKKEFGDFSDIEVKTSVGPGNSFPKLKVKARQEIVALSLGTDDFSPRQTTGEYLAPEELKKWYESGKDFAIVDMRNDYEFKVGHFKNSINPDLENFRDLSKNIFKLEPLKEKTVVTVCTGGVRCEKASGFLKKKGFKDVYQLKGGMHKYMEQFPGQDFLGTLYTFDGRVVMDFGGEREVISHCELCGESSENYINCAYPLCHKHFIICQKCSKGEENFCSKNCEERYKQKSKVSI